MASIARNWSFKLGLTMSFPQEFADGLIYFSTYISVFDSASHFFWDHH